MPSKGIFFSQGMPPDPHAMHADRASHNNYSQLVLLYLCDHARFRIPLHKILIMGSMYLELYTCTSLIVHPLICPDDKGDDYYSKILLCCPFHALMRLSTTNYKAPIIW